MTNALIVYWGSEGVGELRLEQGRDFIFQYYPSWLAKPQPIPLSLRLPLCTEVFEDEAARPFFANLLPEAQVRDMIAKRLGISVRNDFKLLEVLGGECAGAISLFLKGEAPTKQGGYEPLSSQALETMIGKMSEQPLLIAKAGIRLSLAGAQHKLPVYYHEGEFFLPKGNAPSSHILKPQIPFFPQTVENEVFCMMLARAVLLPVPEVALLEGKVRMLMIARYDRKVSADGKLVRVHQEDFCQALGFSYDQKYEGEGGPSLKDCFTLLSRHSSQPLFDKRNLLRWIIFNFLIGNHDAHAKNISLLLTQAGVTLAPYYDLMCTRAYPQLSDRLAMKIGGEDRTKWIARRHWERLAEEADVGVKAVMSLAKEMAAALLTVAVNVEKAFVLKYGEAEIIPKICHYITASSAHLLSQIVVAGGIA